MNRRSIAFRTFATIASIAAIGAGTDRASAAPVQFGSNYYDFVSADDISWAAANTAASASVYLGLNGHLATVTSSAENSFLASNFATFSGFAGGWLGGQVTGSGSGGIGSWVVGPEAGQQFSLGGSAVLGAYANWGGIEPNNAPSAVYMNLGTLFAGIGPGQWADALNGLSSGGDPIRGYLVEYENAAVPIPAALPLFATGIGVMGLLGWRRKKRKNAAALAG